MDGAFPHAGLREVTSGLHCDLGKRHTLPEQDIDRLIVKQVKGIQDSQMRLQSSTFALGPHAAIAVQYLAGCTELLATVGLGSLVITGWVATEHEAGRGSL